MNRCKCGEPMPSGVKCGHCDAPQPSKHGKENCPRCETLMNWHPAPGQFPDLPEGYKNNTKRGA